MNLGELKKQIAIGELSNLIWTKEGTIKPQYEEYIVQFIKDALNVIYARLQLKKEAVFLETVEGKLEYKISNENIMTSPDLEPDYDHYLWLPNKDKFDSDILKIIGVLDHAGKRLPINDIYIKHAVFTPIFNVLQLPALVVAAHKKFEVHLAMAHSDFVNGDSSEIELPSTLIPAVRAYVAYLVHSNMNTENSVSNAQKYLQQYNLVIQEVTPNGAEVTSYITPGHLHGAGFKFETRGWI